MEITALMTISGLLSICGRKEGRKEEREGRKEERKEGREEGLLAK